MTIRRGEIWIATLDPTQGSEQAGVRPIIIFQNDAISRYIAVLKKVRIALCPMPYAHSPMPYAG